MNEQDKIIFESKANKYIELFRQREAIDEELKRLSEDLKEFIPPKGKVAVEMKLLKRVTGDKCYFDESRFKQDNPALHSKYCKYVPQDYIRLMEASKRKGKRKEIKDF